MSTCRHCKRDIPDNALYCPWCGKEQAKQRKRARSEITVPKATLTAAGTWYIRMRLGGESIAVYGPTEAAAKAEAIAIKAGIIDGKKNTPARTLGECIDKYIDDRRGVLSPSTIRGYTQIRQNRFVAAMGKPIATLTDWQRIISQEAETVSAKTLKNAWGLIHTVLMENGVQVKPVTLPQVVRAERPWLDFQQIRTFLDAARGESGELAAILALHSLRRSELCAVTVDDVTDTTITVAGAVVYDANGQITRKDTNKNVSSRRVVPIMISRLQELLPPSGVLVTETPNSVGRQINRICDRAGLPQVGVHGLRHSFASLAYHLGMSERETMELGGWSDASTIHRIYLHLAQADRLTAANKMADFYRTCD